MFNGIMNSLGKIQLDGTTHVWTAFLLSLIPSIHSSGSVSRVIKQRALICFFAAQVALVGGYTISALWKLRAAIYQIGAGEVNLFSSQAFPQLIAATLDQYGTDTVLGSWLIQHGRVAQPILLVGVLLQLSALLLVFRVRWHRCLGAALVLFHVTTFLIFAIPFPGQIIQLMCLLVVSPYRSFKNQL